MRWQFPGYIKDPGISVLLKYVWNIPPNSFGWFLWVNLCFYEISLIMTGVEWNYMACSISLYYPREDTGSLFSLFLSIQAPSLPNALCRVGGMFLHGAPGIFFCLFVFADREIQTSRVKELWFALWECAPLFSLWTVAVIQNDFPPNSGMSLSCPRKVSLWDYPVNGARRWCWIFFSFTDMKK